MGRDKDNKKRCGFCCCTATLSVVIFAGVMYWYFAVFAKDVEASIADCGGCFCIPDSTTSGRCPSTPAPPTSYPEDTHLNAWKSQTILNPYVLNCNPFEDGVFCDTEPPLDPDYRWVVLGETAVCAVHYEPMPSDVELRWRGRQLEENEQHQQQPSETEIRLYTNQTETEIETTSADDGMDPVFTVYSENDSCESTKYYRIKTYPSQEDAENAGGFVTHIGNCGVCSTLQDLAVYATMEAAGVTSPGNFCRRQSTSSLENGLSCYLGLGLTQDCAKIWADTSWNTAKNCFGSCVINPTLPTFRGDFGNRTDVNATETSSSDKWYNLPITLKNWFNSNETESEKTAKTAIASNGPAPECALSACLTCNDEVSAPTFERFAGRSRRRSGLLATAARPCGSIPKIEHDPCPATRPLEE